MPLGDPASVDVAKLRVAYYTDDGTLAVAPAVRRAVIEAAGMLAGRGAQVTEWRPSSPARWTSSLACSARMAALRSPQLDVARMTHAWRSCCCWPRARASVGLVGAAARRGSATSRRMARNFGHRRTAGYWRLVEAQMAYQRDFLDALDTDDGGPFDVIICPACALPAIPHGASKDLLTAGGYAMLYNVLGYPTGVVPVTRVREDEESPRKRSLDRLEGVAGDGTGSAGLPVGVQVVARPWREHWRSRPCAPSKPPCAGTQTILASLCSRRPKHFTIALTTAGEPDGLRRW